MPELDVGPPPVKGFKEKPFNISYALVAINTVKRALPYLSVASPYIGDANYFSY